MGSLRSQTMVFAFLVFHVRQVYGQTIQDTQDLMDTLLNGYNRDIRPITDQSAPIQVNVSFDLVAIQEFDEVSEIFAAVGLINLAWIDQRMTWNPYLYNNTYTVNIRKDRVWIPDLILTNPKESIRVLGDRQDWMIVRYYPSGYAVWTPGDVFHSSCKVDVTYYPFDVQKCEMNFIPWGYSAFEVNLNADRNEVLRTFFTENGEWMFKSSKTTSVVMADGLFSLFKVDISIQRRAAFFLVNVVIPIIFMSFLNVLVFWVPAESGERVSYAITVLLAIAVFLTIVGDNMPKSSKPMSILCYFLIINLVLSALICVGAIFNLNVYFKHWEHPVPKWLDKLTRILICKRPSITKTPVEEIVDRVDTGTATTKGEKKSNKKVNKWAEAIDEISVGVPRDHKPVTWREVSYAIDKVFGLISVLWLIISSTCFIVMAATQNASTLG